MKTVGFINPPSGHMSRGIGFYTKNILPELQRLAPRCDINLEVINSKFEFRNSKLDLVHYPYFDFFSHSLPIFSGQKTIVNIYDTIPLIYPTHYPSGVKGQIYLQLQKLALKNVSAVITDSYSVIGDLVKHLSIRHEKIKLTYLAGAPHFKKSSTKPKTPLPENYILYVGDINYNKNLPLLVQSAHNLKIPLVIVGKSVAKVENLDLSHPELSHLIPIKDLLQTSPYIVRTGFVDDEELVAIYNHATICCQPSLSEGFGLSVIEAMACGTPTIISDTPALIEISNSASVVFDKNSQASLESAITQVWKDKNLQKKLSSAGLVRASEFSWVKTARETLEIYKSLL